MQGKKIVKILRYINIFCAYQISLVVILSVLSLIFVVVAALTSLKFFLIFSPVFMIAFGLAMLAAQFKVKFVLKRLPFLGTLLGKALFNIYLSSVIYYYFDASQQSVLAWVGAISLFVSGCIYLGFYLGCAKKLEKQVDQPEVEPQVEENDETRGRQPLM